MDQQTNIGGTSNPNQSEKRMPRRRMLKTAVASYNNRSISFEVVVRDMSDTGVKLKLRADEPLPDHFTLIVEMDGLLVDCEVVWRRGMEIGARFVSETRQITPKKSQVVESSSKRKGSLLRKPLY